ncbi:MAG: hypothetical protein IIA44_15490 [Acidobacteria bacterium]|nr:hypothetical protein [Acidobacteriota bacterium]
MLPRLALPGRRFTTLGATHDFHHGLLAEAGGPSQSAAARAIITTASGGDDPLGRDVVNR